MAGAMKKSLPLKSVNHVSRNCRDLQASLAFYEHVLGFVPIKRPGSFDFDGAWLYNYGIGIHLLQIDNKELGSVPPVKKEINPRDDHISFQCEDILLVQAMLQENGTKWTCRVITEGGVEVEQVFFHDPDGFMIEICTCEKLPVQPLVASTLGRYLSGKCNNTSNSSLDEIAALSLQLLQASDPPLQGVIDTISSSSNNNNCVVCA